MADDADFRLFSEAYRGTPPWDIGRAQPAFVELANAGKIKGRVLDVGCGTGENVLDLADRGLEVWGIDIVPAAVERAKEKARERGLDAHFAVHDALQLAKLGERFDTLVDCGLFHVFSDQGRILYEQSLKAAIKPEGTLFLMCFSEKEDAAWGGPRRVSQVEILQTFSHGWSVIDVAEARFVTNFPQIRGHAWLAEIVRTDSPVKLKPKEAQAETPLVM